MLSKPNRTLKMRSEKLNVENQSKLYEYAKINIVKNKLNLVKIEDKMSVVF